jgi:hypothetical protein
MPKTAKALEAEERELQADLDRLIEDKITEEALRNAAIFVGVIVLGVLLDLGLLLLLGA